MRSGESFPYGPIAASTAQFQLDGGKYWFSAVGTFNSATIALQRVGPDGNTLMTPITGLALTTAGGYVADLPPGTYQITITGSTTAYLWTEVVRINEE